MKILAVDTTGAVMSAALSDDSTVIDEIFGDSNKKHLETLMPAVECLLDRNGLILADIDVFAVSVGPGSFTGIRIGTAAVCALAQTNRKAVAEVDTLSALCANVHSSGFTCALIDAGHDEVFARIENNGTEVLPSGPVLVEKLMKMLPDEKIIFVGDGAEVYRTILEQHPDSAFAENDSLYQSAASVCRVAFSMAVCGQLSTYKEVSPRYLRESQAERMKNAGK